MRSALSLTLVLIAAMSGHGASACEVSQHQLRLLLSPAFSQSLDQGSQADFSLTADLPVSASNELRLAEPSFNYVELSTDPASRSYESAKLATAPSRGP